MTVTLLKYYTIYIIYNIYIHNSVLNLYKIIINYILINYIQSITDITIFNNVILNIILYFI